MCGLLFLLIGVGLAADHRSGVGAKAFAWVLVAFSLRFIYRGVLSATVLVSSAAVSLRSLFRTRRYPLATIERAEVKVGRTGPNGFGRQYPVLHLATGSEVPFRELNAKPPKPAADPSVVQRAVELINQAILEAN